jgi:hypothetical protein
MMNSLFAYQLRRVSTSALFACFAATFLAFAIQPRAVAGEAPRLENKDGRYTLLVDGHPYLILGGQIHNSSGWPSELPHVWDSMATLHANTVEAPVYWEQLEPTEGHFDFANVDQILTGARAHDLHVVLLWFGTWKNGNMHYAPEWIKTDTQRFPRIVRSDGEPIDVLSPLSRNTLEADKAAFVELTRHLKQIDGEQHTILLIQVENESGNVGSVRDFSREANIKFSGKVPADLLTVTHHEPGTWSEIFGGEADEMFQTYYQAKFINEVTAAGKAEFPIPYYINVWLNYPAAQLPQRVLDQPGIAYPSGGAVQKLLSLWRAMAPAIDMIGPDIYSNDSKFYREAMDTYHRPDNPLWIPETGSGNNFAKFFFYAVGEGAIGFSPFGVDGRGRIAGDSPSMSHASNFALIGPMDREIAELEFAGKLKTAVEEPGKTTEELDFDGWQATVAFGFPQPDGRSAPGTKDAHAAALVAQIGPDEFLVTGVDASVIFHLPGKQPWIRSQILTAEQGAYDNHVWKTTRLLNGDETDRGLRFSEGPEAVHVKMQRF